jgi:hypothetical protein
VSGGLFHVSLGSGRLRGGAPQIWQAECPRPEGRSMHGRGFAGLPRGGSQVVAGNPTLTARGHHHPLICLGTGHMGTNWIVVSYWEKPPLKTSPSGGFFAE